MNTVTLEDAQNHLAELIDQLQPGEEIVILRAEKPVAKLVAQPCELQQDRNLGAMRGTVLYMAPDFDAPLDDFKEYME